MKNRKKDKKKNTISTSLDHLSEYLAPRKGLIPLIGMAMILFNLFLQFFFYGSWVSNTNLFLHLGTLTAIFGLMLAWAL
jgi:membrane-bound ClpP family serine protease